MAKYCLKKPSKRLTSRKKFKIQKKVREHSKKMKKLAKEGEKKRAEKPISVPNKCPFKEEILLEAEKKRKERKEEEEERKAQQKAAKRGKLGEKTKKRKAPSGAEDMEVLAKRAAQEEENYTENQFLLETLPDRVESDGNSKAVKTYATQVRKTIEEADIILEVLDARDPLGSRSKQIEKLVVESGKRLVLLLNKSDLVPKENLRKWLAYLRQQLPTIAFKASTQEQNQKLGRFTYSNLMNSSLSSKCIGADLVMKLLGNYCRNKDLKTSIRVGVVGFPNVGKSSVVNSLKRKKSCQTGATPGLTKQMQEVQLDKHIRLIDSPGVVLAPKGELDPSELALKNVVRVETLEDPVTPIHAILRRCSIKVLMLHYRIPEFTDCDQFLALLSRRFGRLKKGGRPDMNAAAKQVLNDWNSGKLRYYTEPPEAEENRGDDEPQLLSAELVQQFSKEFNLDALDQDIRVIVDEMPEDHMTVDTPYNASVVADSEQLMETDESRFVVIGGDMDAKAKANGAERNQSSAMETGGQFLPKSLAIGEGNVQLGRAIKNAMKKRKKNEKRISKKAENLADKLGTGMELG